MRDDPTSLYRDRRLIEGYPGLDALGLERGQAALAQRPDDTQRMRDIFVYLDRLVDLRQRRNFLVVGCGPRPDPMRVLREMGFNVVGVEPVPDFVSAARQYLDDDQAVMEGRAEEL